VPRDEARAAELYRSAGAVGDARSLYNLGVMTANGRGTARDPQRAQTLWRDAAGRGDPYAAYALARTIEQSGGSLAEVARFDRMAAERGHLPAATRYGLALAQGRGTSRDEARAWAWLQHAADAGLPEAMAALGDVAAREAAAVAPGRAREQAQARAIGWFRIASEAGHSGAQHRYANALAAGVASAGAQPTDALIWQRRAAGPGTREAQYGLGVWMSGGVLGPKDPADGYRWLLLAQRAGQTDAPKVAAKARESLSAAEIAQAERAAAQFAPVAERPRAPEDSWPLKIPARIP
jgi:TPR repeat protein